MSKLEEEQVKLRLPGKFYGMMIELAEIAHERKRFVVWSTDYVMVGVPKEEYNKYFNPRVEGSVVFFDETNHNEISKTSN